MRLVHLPLMFLLLATALPAGAATLAEAEALLKAKDPRGEAVIKGLVKAQPKNAAVRVLEARMLLLQGKADDAVDAAEEAVELDPDSAQAHYWLGNAYGTRIGQVGMLSQAMIAPKLRDAFVRAVALDPDLHDARSSLIEFYLQAPSIAGGDPAKARVQAAELLRRDPPRGHHAQGRLAMHDKKPAEAAKAFAAAYAARPDNTSYRMAAGVAFQEAKQWEAAFDLFTAWTREDPKAGNAWYQVGRTAALSGQRLDAGIAALKRYLALPIAEGAPEAHYAWYRLGQVQAKAGDKVAARASFQAALKGDPGNDDFEAALAAL